MMFKRHQPQKGSLFRSNKYPDGRNLSTGSNNESRIIFIKAFVIFLGHEREVEREDINHYVFGFICKKVFNAEYGYINET